jgi:hypothetical protein
VDGAGAGGVAPITEGHIQVVSSIECGEKVSMLQTMLTLPKKLDRFWNELAFQEQLEHSGWNWS